MDELTKIYKEEDFLTGTKPYEEVYRLHNDPLSEQQAIERIAKNAKMVHVPNFKTLYKAYCATRKSAEPEGSGNVTQFTGQPFELFCDYWTADDDGVSFINNMGVEFDACVHPIMPIRRLINVDTRIAKLEIAYKIHDRWESCIVDKKTVSSASSIIELADYGIAVNSENAKFLVKYLHDTEYLNMDTIPEISSVTRLGWIDGKGFSPYIDDLVYDGEVSFAQMFEAVKERGSEEEWFKLAKEVRASGNIPARIMLAASFASVLVKPMRKLPFFVHLWGGTETGKTVGLMLATSVWANPEMGQFCKTFNATAVSQELTAGFVNSLPLIMDELQLVKDRRSFDKTIYQLAQGTGKDRGKKSGGLQKVQTWQNCILTTGEQPMTNDISGGGAMNRVIEVNCEDVRLFKDPAHVSDVVKQNYGFAGRRFVALLTDEMLELAKGVCDDAYTELIEKSTEKQAQAASLVIAADEIATHLLFKDQHALTTADLAPFLFSKEDVNVNLHALEWLRGWLVQNSSKFEWLDGDSKPEIWGKKDPKETKIINHVFNRACADEGYNARAVARWLVRNGYFVADSQGKSTRVCNLYGQRIRCYVFRDKAESNTITPENDEN